MGPGRARTAALAVVLGGTAIGLRVWRLRWGLDEGLFFPDELLFTTRLQAFWPLSWHSFALPELTYPALYGYLGGLVAALLHGVGWLGPPRLLSVDTVCVLRAVSAAAGVANVGLVGLLGARFYSPAVGLGAAGLMAVLPLDVLQVHYASVDVLLAACATLAMLGAFALARRGTVAAALLAGGAAGVAFAAKYTGTFLLAPVAWAVLESGVRARSAGRAVVLGTAALAGFAVAAALACPPCALHPDRMLTAIQWHRVNSSFLASGFRNNFLVPTLGWYGRRYLYQLVASLPFSLGWPLYGLALLGLVRAVRRLELADRLVLATLVPGLLLIGWSYVTFPRYLVPLFPGLVVLASRVVLEGTRGRAARLAVLAAVWGYSLALSASQVTRFSWEQQKAVVRWIIEARPAHGWTPQTRVAVPYVHEALDYFKVASVLQRVHLTYIPAADGHWLDAAPDVFVLPEWKAISVRRDEPHGPAARDLERLESGAAGYREAARWESGYLQRDFYCRLDPAFASDLWQGEIGFRVYAREGPPQDPP